jgi:hypothetical protein
MIKQSLDTIKKVVSNPVYVRFIVFFTTVVLFVLGASAPACPGGLGG